MVLGICSVSVQNAWVREEDVFRVFFYAWTKKSNEFIPKEEGVLSEMGEGEQGEILYPMQEQNPGRFVYEGYK